MGKGCRTNLCAGYGHAMNIGMDYARGEYIGIVESYGAWCGLLVWAPVVGDPLAAALGLAHSPAVATCLLMLAGKALRYIAIVFIADKLSAAIKRRHKTQGEIAAVIQYNYPIFTDDFIFRLNPGKFVELRSNYKYRREFYVEY